MAAPRIEFAVWTSFTTGLVSLSRDWRRSTSPPIFWGEAARPLAHLQRGSLLQFGSRSGYFVDGEDLVFVLRRDRYSALTDGCKDCYVAGDFNGWAEAIGKRQWKLEKVRIQEVSYHLLTVKKEHVYSDKHPRNFKFVTGEGVWLEVPGESPNAVWDETGNQNFQIRPWQTGQHLFIFSTPKPLNRVGQGIIHWKDHRADQTVPMRPGRFLLNMQTRLPLGVISGERETVFRLFAPRASEVKVFFYHHPEAKEPQSLSLAPVDAGTWEARYPSNLAGWFYHYTVDSGAQDPLSKFDGAYPILDPYAQATLGPNGPGVIIDPRRTTPRGTEFCPPAWEDLVIVEAHVRDLTQLAPVAMKEEERRGFTGLRKWVESPDFYLSELGVNAVELQPIQQFDAPTTEEYAWGYMPVNWFAPSSHYTTDAAAGKQIEEFRDLVGAFHRRDLAVILDVVYNHYGEPNHLQYIDMYYYFDLAQTGEYMNWSGCGNTFRADTPMGRRLIIDSLIHLVKTFDVDGFRFDLAELIGKETLRAVEKALKQVKPGIILIAEPWSFRGHIAHALRDTGFASWNDGYRNFMAEYLRGHGNPEGLRYFMGGSLDHLAAWPAQSVNYVESHDDSCWLDRITENPAHNGIVPTARDIRRSRLMAAILFSSLGIPMISAGQDFLRSKQGHHNTYLAGEINALDYHRLREYGGVHKYFRDWIALRRSPAGRLLRLGQRPRPGYLGHRYSEGTSALGIHYNESGELGSGRLFFAVNPHDWAVTINLQGLPLETYTQLADHTRVEESGLRTARLEIRDDLLYLPSLSCGLWHKA